MRVKSYYSESVEAAMVQARQELGADAMLLSSRKTAPETKHLGEYEVVFALAQSGNFEEELTRATERVEPPAAVDRLTQEVADLRRQLERTASMFQRANTLTAGAMANGGEHLKLLSRLVACEVAPELAHNLISEVRRSIGECCGEELEDAVRAGIARLFRADATLGLDASTPKVAALVGPPGAGKTSTLVKLAIRQGLALRRRVHIITLDSERIGAYEQLRSYATVLGVGVDAAVNASSLGALLEACSRRDLVLIDTPGLAPADADLATDLRRTLAEHPQIDVQLVLPATGKASDLDRTAQRFESFSPGKLIFTRLDETQTFGALLNLSIGLQRPISFLATGQNIPEDVQAASAEILASLIVDGRSAETRLAAA